MASAPPATELADVRALAQKLFAQCKGRDAPNSYKLLAASVRSLRNGLEEVEEDYDPTRTLGPDDVRLLDQITRSHDILNRLDLALQSYKRSTHKDVNMNAISDLKTALDVTTHELKLAFEATTTGGIPDTREFTGEAHPSASLEDSTSPSRSRKSSVWSTPQSPGASDATSLHNDRADRYPGEEKQVVSPSASMDWRSPFADPLSMGIEAATSFILGGDDDLAMSPYARPTARSRAGSNMSAATETFFSAPWSPEMERKPSTPNMDAAFTTEALASHNESNGQSMPANDFSRPSSSGTEQPDERRLSTANPDEGQGHLSPQTATRELALKRSRTNSSASVKQDVDVGVANLSSPRPEEHAADESASARPIIAAPIGSPSVMSESDLSSVVPTQTGTQHGSSPSLPLGPAPASPPKSRAHSLPTRIALAGSHKASNGSASRDIATQPMDTVTSVQQEEPQTADSHSAQASTGASTPPVEEVRQEEPASPPPPSRKPPPPPPAVRRSKPKPKPKLPQPPSKYRIVNDAPDDSSSDDELYTSSRPTSPVIANISPSAQSPALVTPTIQIDESALDDVQQPEQATASREIQGNQTAQDVSEDGGLRQSVYRPKSSVKPPIFARKQSSESGSQQTIEVVKEDASTAQSSPGPESPQSSKSSQGPESPASTSLPPSVQKRVKAAVKASDIMLVNPIEARFQRDSKPPPVPPRPSKSRYNNRPRAATTTSSPAVLTEKEPAAVEPGIEVSDGLLASKPGNPRLTPRVSIDHALNVSGQVAIPLPDAVDYLEGTRHGRSASTSQLPPPQSSLREARLPSAPGAEGHRLTGWYGPGADETTQSELDQERIEHIGHFWNNMTWDRAEEYLMAYLESLIEQNNMAIARRVRHLLGVCAAFKGDVARAITMFVSVLEISEPSDLSKPGNAEACYWLGDLYALQNQRLEALLAYCAAQWGDLFNDPEEPNMCELIKAEQDAVQLGRSKSDFKVRWSQEAREGSGTILDPRILPASVVQHLFEVEPRRQARTPYPHVATRLDENKPRSSAFFALSTSTQWAKFRRSKIAAEHFHPYGPWPLQYDPTFTMANVKRERLLSYECDILDFLQKNGEAKIPKTGPMSLSRMDCFTCGDLLWLITAVRECLGMLEMDWSEVANDQGVWFVVRHTTMDGTSTKPAAMKIATVHYFAISLFRQSFRSSYGVEICSHGVSSARIMDPSNLELERGVHQHEPKRIKKLIRETLEEAEKRRPKAKRRASAIGLGISRSSGDDQPVKVVVGSEIKPPPVPPRPGTRKPSGPGAFATSSFISSS